MTEGVTLTVQRPWSLAALILGAGTIVFAVVVFVTAFPRGLTVLACAALAVAAAWWGICRRGAARSAALVLAGLLLLGAVALIVFDGDALDDSIVLVAFAAALYCAREALRPRVRWPSAQRPERPVLFYNPKSGGGKATRFHLADEARRRGIDPIELQRGQDLETLVRDAVAEGADGLAMAGGDGSQAIVAMVAAELGLPYACIPAGTRNHFALDLGVNRDDVVGALDAFVNGGERTVDLAEVNGRVFVNNVSLGLYADAVQRPGYREAKLHTLLDTVPDVLGPDAAVPDLSWRGPNGPESAVAILISNNQYRIGRAIGSGTRPRLDGGTLGITVLAPIRADRGSITRKLGMQQWTAPDFEVDSNRPVPAGLDGEAVTFDAPVRFRTHPHSLRVRIAPHHPGASPSALTPDRAREMFGTLVRLAVHGARSLPA
jgi:diacylglycerol kinase family enzyme